MTYVPFILDVILIVIYPTVYTYNMYTSAYLSAKSVLVALQNSHMLYFVCFLQMQYVIWLTYTRVHTRVKDNLVFFQFRGKDGQYPTWNGVITALAGCNVICYLQVLLCWCHVFLQMFMLDDHIKTHARRHTRTRTHATYEHVVMISDVVVSVSIWASELRCPTQHTAACSRQLLLLLLEQWPLMEHGTFTYDRTRDSRGQLPSVCFFDQISKEYKVVNKQWYPKSTYLIIYFTSYFILWIRSIFLGTYWIDRMFYFPELEKQCVTLLTHNSQMRERICKSSHVFRLM